MKEVSSIGLIFRKSLKSRFIWLFCCDWTVVEWRLVFCFRYWIGWQFCCKAFTLDGFERTPWGNRFFVRFWPLSFYRFHVYEFVERRGHKVVCTFFRVNWLWSVMGWKNVWIRFIPEDFLMWFGCRWKGRRIGFRRWVVRGSWTLDVTLLGFLFDWAMDLGSEMGHDCQSVQVEDCKKSRRTSFTCCGYALGFFCHRGLSFMLYWRYRTKWLGLDWKVRRILKTIWRQIVIRTDFAWWGTMDQFSYSLDSSGVRINYCW